jgi:DNA polymerase I-like protein with 3'-5' exonuclease and polymerase domains
LIPIAQARISSRTAAEMFGFLIDQVGKDQRDIAKTINFGLCHGMGSKGLSERSNITGEKAENFIQKYSRAYPQLKNTLQQLGTKVVEELYSDMPRIRKRHYHAAQSNG